jgi:arsenite methyltransferase
VTQDFDFGETRSRHIEETYLQPDIVRQRRDFCATLDLRPGLRALDVGSGPGLLAQDLAERAGPGGMVVGVDPSPSMLRLARARTAGARVFHVQGTATAVPVQDRSFDLAVSTQVLEYVPEIDVALAEMRRVVRPGGTVAILDTDWRSIVWSTSLPDLQARILEAWDQHLHDPHLPQHLPAYLKAAGLELEDCRAVGIVNTRFEERTYSRRTLGSIANFVSGRNGIDRQDVDRWATDLAEHDRRGDYFFSLTRYAFVARRPA